VCVSANVLFAREYLSYTLGMTRYLNVSLIPGIEHKERVFSSNPNRVT